MNNTTNSTDIATFKEVECSEIRRFENQPRVHFSKKRLQSLKAAIDRYGQLEYAQVMVLPPGETHPYELIDGECRWKVCGELGIPLRCLVRRDIDGVDDQYLRSFLANGGQENLPHYDCIKALAKIKATRGLTNEGVAQLIGRSKDWVQERLALTKFGPEFLELMRPTAPEGRRLPYTHAVLVSRVPRNARAKLIEVILRDKLSPTKIRELVKKNSNIVSRGGYEFIKCMSLARRIMDDSRALNGKRGNFKVMFQNRSEPENDAAKMLRRLECASENLAVLQKVLSQFTGDTAKQGTPKVTRSA